MLQTSRPRPIVVRVRPVRQRRRSGLRGPLVLLTVLAGLVLLTWGRINTVRTQQVVRGLTQVATAPAVTATPARAALFAVPLLPTAMPPSPSPTTAAEPTATASPTPVPTVTATPIPAFYSNSWLQAHPAANPPAITAKAALVVDYDTRHILYSHNPSQHLAQASTTKITLADVALDVASPDKQIKINKDATEVEPNHMGVQVGEILSLQELLYGAFLDSGNDAGWAIAEGIGGLDHAVALMNQRAVALSLHDTHYANPVGFDDPAHYTSVYDLAVLTADALTRHPLIKDIAGTKKQIIESSKTHSWFGPTNLNSLLWTYPGAWGIKPGWTEQAEYCLVAAATRDNHTVLVTLLGSKDHFADGTALLNYGFARIAAGEH